MQAIGVARVGQETQLLAHGTLRELSLADFGAPLHSLVLVGETHDMEQSMMELFARKAAKLPRAPAEGEGTDDSEGETQ